MSSEELRPYEKEFIDKTAKVLAKFKSIKDDKNYTYDPNHIDGVELINFRSVGDHMVETTVILNLIIAPIWAKNGEFTDMSNNWLIAKKQFENYYADKNQKLPNNKWCVPLKLAFNYCTYDYKIGSFENLKNYKNNFLSYESALQKYQDYRRKYDKLMKIVKESKKKN